MKLSVKLLSILSVLVLIFVSGCVGSAEASGGSNKAVSVKSLSITPTNWGEGETASYSASFVNEGGAAAQNVCVLVYGPSWLKDGSNDIWLEDGGSTCTTGSMMEKPVSGQTLIPMYITTDLDISNAPNPVESEEPHKITTRVYSKYSTKADTKLTVLSSEEYTKRRNCREGQSCKPLTQEPILIKTSAGPILVGTEGNNPVTPKTDGTAKTVTINFLVQNVGGGIIFDSAKTTGQSTYATVAGADHNKVRLKSLTASGRTGDISCGKDNARQGGNVTVTNGILSCKVTIASSTVPEQIVPVILELEYGYYSEESSILTIRQGLEATGQFVKPLLKAFSNRV